jgi:hypothetical protein
VIPVRMGLGRYDVEIAWRPLGATLREALDAAKASDHVSG